MDLSFTTTNGCRLDIHLDCECAGGPAPILEQPELHPDNVEPFVAANPRNPFDEIGQAHNLGLEAIRRQLSDAPTADEIVELERAFARSHRFTSEALAAENELDRDALLDRMDATAIIGGCTPLPWPLPWPGRLPDWLRERFDGMFRDAHDFDYARDSLVEIKRELVAIDEAILAAKLEPKQAMVAHATTSIFSHSIAFWQQAKPKPPRWLILGVADVAGGLVGFGLSLGTGAGTCIGSRIGSGVVGWATKK